MLSNAVACMDLWVLASAPLQGSKKCPAHVWDPLPASLSSLVKAMCVWRRNGRTCFRELAVQALTPSAAHVQSHLNGLQATGNCRSVSPSGTRPYRGPCRQMRKTPAVRGTGQQHCVGTGQHLPRVVAAKEPLAAVILHKDAVLDAHKLRLATSACAQQRLLGGPARCCSSGLRHREPQSALEALQVSWRWYPGKVLARAGQASMLDCHLLLPCCSLVDRLPVVACQLIRVINSLAKLMGQSSSRPASAPLGH